MLSSLDTNRCATAKSWQAASSDFVPHSRETGTLRMRISKQCSPFFTSWVKLGIKKRPIQYQRCMEVIITENTISGNVQVEINPFYSHLATKEEALITGNHGWTAVRSK